jgi:toxin HigB-1
MTYYKSNDRVVYNKIMKQLNKIPVHVADKLRAWAFAVENKGLREVRKISGYHDEPLMGKRFGQRSIRLNRSYRAIYKEEPSGLINLIVIEEVNKHEY